MLTARALSLRIAGVSIGTDAALLAADCVQTADVAGLAAHLTDAARAGSAVPVRAALGLHTAARGVASEAGWTGADGPPLLHAAHGRRRTRFLRAGVGADALDAGEIRRAVGAAPAAGQGRTASGRVSAVAGPALARGHVVDAAAHGGPVTRVGRGPARAHAVATNALLVKGAVGVAHTARCGDG